jgi:Zn-finger nucleic acid-binding protein
MAAKTLNCPNCGAAMAGDESACRYCGGRLATVACPSCFGMMFAGSKHCPHCGAAASRGPVEDANAKLNCPACEAPLVPVVLGQTILNECGRCFGVWLDTQTFEQICAEREQQAVILGRPEPQEIDVNRAWRYLPCAACGHLMQRVNFAGQSGVIVDVCRDHGVWFEREELRRIVEFIRAGGMYEAREAQLERLERERQRLERDRRDASDGSVSHANPNVWGADNDNIPLFAIRLTSDLMKLFRRR